jgi:23S rRNA pseudouridine1911/1915/1917 synthase
VHGSLTNQEVDFPIDTKPSQSRIETIRTVRSLLNEMVSLVKLEPITGRTHQLRIHCAEIGHSIVGDQLYENKQGTFRNKGLLLAATNLTFIHPIISEKLEVSIPIPHKFISLLDREENRAAKYDKD